MCGVCGVSVKLWPGHCGVDGVGVLMGLFYFVLSFLVALVWGSGVGFYVSSYGF